MLAPSECWCRCHLAAGCRLLSCGATPLARAYGPTRGTVGGEIEKELAGVGAEMGFGALGVGAGAGERGCFHRNAGKFVVRVTFLQGESLWKCFVFNGLLWQCVTID